MKNNFSVDIHLTLDLDDSVDLYLYEYLLYVGNQLVDSSFSNVIINVLVNSAHNDKDFMTFAQFLDKFCDNSEVMKWTKSGRLPPTLIGG